MFESRRRFLSLVGAALAATAVLAGPMAAQASAAIDRNLSHYALFALGDLSFKGRNGPNPWGYIRGGNIGCNQDLNLGDNQPSIGIGANGYIHLDDNTQVVGGSIRLGEWTDVFDVYVDPAGESGSGWGATNPISAGPTVRGTVYSISNAMDLPIIPFGNVSSEVLCGSSTWPSVAGKPDFTVPKNTDGGVLPLGEYGVVRVQDGGTLTLGSGIYTVQQFRTGKNVSIYTQPDTKLHIWGDGVDSGPDFNIGDGGYFGPLSPPQDPVAEVCLMDEGNPSVRNFNPKQHVQFGWVGEFWGVVIAPTAEIHLGHTWTHHGRFVGYSIGSDWNVNVNTPPPPGEGPPVISPDLIAQQDTICIPAMVKVHPTLQLSINKESLYYDCLNPATNPSADLTFTVQVKSNLPFRKQITITPFQFTPNGVPGDVLQSYKYVGGQWVLAPWDPAVDGPEPGTGDTIPTTMQSVYITEVNGETGEVTTPETEVADNGVFPASGAVGDINNHIWEDRVRWRVGPINWCVTAGYYVGQICVTVYQN